MENPQAGSLPVEQVVVGTYRFEKRLVPDPPNFLKDSGKATMIVQKEDVSNSWVWMGSPLLAEQIKDLAKTYDVGQVEMDLEFCLVLVSSDKLSERGLSVFYDPKASWLNALALQGDSGSLRISSGGWAADLRFSDADSGISVISQPVVRCLDGIDWEFANDSEVPVPSSEIVDGTIRNSVDFRPSGFGLKGVVRIVGKEVLLQVEQRNGSIAPTNTPAVTAADVPTFNNQKLKSALKLAWWEWSVLGGIQVDKEQLRKGFFRSTKQTTSDYLVIFVRPRLALEAAPSAIPVGSNRTQHPMLDGDGVLPPKRWTLDSINKEIDRVEADIKARLGHPAHN